MVLVQVGGEVVEQAVAGIDHHLPIAHAQAHHVGFVEFPVKELVLLLPFLAEEGGLEGDAVEAVGADVLVEELVGVAVDAGEVAEGGQKVVEGELMVVDRASLHLARPAHDEGNAYAALIGAALLALQESVAVEEVGVCAAFLMRAVVGGKDNDGVLVEPALFEFCHNLTHLRVEARDHRGKLGVAVVGGVVARTLVAAKGLLLAEMPLVGEEDRVFGLHQFGVRQGVGEDAEERRVGSLLVEPSHSLLVDEVGGILRTVAVAVAIHRVVDVLVERHAAHALVAARAAVFVEEVGVVEVCLELADVAVELIDAALVGRGGRALVAAGPFAEHARGVALLLEDFGNDDVVHVVRLLPHHGVVGVAAVHHGAGVAPIFLIAAHVGVAGVLPGHERGA